MKGAKRVIAVDYIGYRLNHAKRTNNVEIFDFTEYDDMAKHLKEITYVGADVVIDCVGLDGKMTGLEMVESALKLQGGAMGAIVIASQTVRKDGTGSCYSLYSRVVPND